MQKRLPSLRQLECFLAVTDEQSFRKAADLLYMTQPPLTRQIKNLECFLGVILFDRSGHTVTLTTEGLRLYESVRPILLSFRDCLQKFAAPVGSEPMLLRIGMTTVVDPTSIPTFKEMFASAGLEACIVVERHISRRLFDMLSTGKIDLALVGIPSTTPQNVEFEPLYQEPMIVALAKDHPKAGKDRLTFDDIAEDVLFIFERARNPAYSDRCEQIFKQFGYGPRRRPEPEGTHTTLSLVSSGEGIALIPASLRTIRRDGVIYRRFTDEIESQLCITLGLSIRKGEVSRVILEAKQAISVGLRATSMGFEAQWTGN